MPVSRGWGSFKTLHRGVLEPRAASGRLLCPPSPGPTLQVSSGQLRLPLPPVELLLGPILSLQLPPHPSPGRPGARHCPPSGLRFWAKETPSPSPEPPAHNQCPLGDGRRATASGDPPFIWTLVTGPGISPRGCQRLALGPRAGHPPAPLTSRRQTAEGRDQLWGARRGGEKQEGHPQPLPRRAASLPSADGLVACGYALVLSPPSSPLPGLAP